MQPAFVGGESPLKIIDRILNVVVAVLWVGFLGYIVVRPGNVGWDFQVYRQAGKEFLNHGDPYLESSRFKWGRRTLTYRLFIRR